MPRHTAACAAVLALLGSAHADAPAFTGVSELPSIGGQNLRSHAGARGGLVPRMVAGPQDYLTSLEDSRTGTSEYTDQDGAAAMQNRAAVGAARFYSMDLIAKTRSFLDSFRNGNPDRDKLAAGFEFTCSGSSEWTKDDFLAGRVGVGAEFYEFSMDPHDSSRVWFQARSLGQVQIFARCVALYSATMQFRSYGCASDLVNINRQQTLCSGARSNLMLMGW